MYYVIGLTIFVTLYYCFVGSSSSKPAPKQPEKKDFTREQLRSFDGTKNDLNPEGKVYLACNDYVFDVTGSPFYTGDGDYACFGGRDITIACAYHSKSEEHLSQVMTPETKLTFDQEQMIQGFFMTFCQKYDIVGKIVEDKK